MLGYSFNKVIFSLALWPSQRRRKSTGTIESTKKNHAWVGIEPLTFGWQASALPTIPRGYDEFAQDHLSSCSSCLEQRPGYCPWGNRNECNRRTPAECNTPLHAWLYYTPGEKNEHPWLPTLFEDFTHNSGETDQGKKKKRTQDAKSTKVFKKWHDASKSASRFWNIGDRQR